MKIIYQFIFLFSTVQVAAQDTTIKQLQFIVEDARFFFEKTKGSKTLGVDSTPRFLSTITLNGTVDNEISISEDGKTWAFYAAYVIDSASFKDVKKRASYWRDLVANNIVGYVEEKTKKEIVNWSGKPSYSYHFVRKEGTTEYSILISYSERLRGGYMLFLQIGRAR